MSRILCRQTAPPGPDGLAVERCGPLVMKHRVEVLDRLGASGGARPELAPNEP